MHFSVIERWDSRSENKYTRWNSFRERRGSVSNAVCVCRAFLVVVWTWQGQEVKEEVWCYIWLVDMGEQAEMCR